ncbi:uncharacterized protein ColSpa_05538 [Colletotrichum spaethianum]|uniref:Cell wall protein n=1 Tax=Colletotrichum spaethianum TaxID=700344 RepID=A0AA37LJQ4_9PEZI|nr:uncharacterized protein ColSpa_05538 [Colletotrichum spaethianum]GKT45357.1 hypothetical protein ColSpa_05538 [Colletotrichum spaethianum]
MHSLHLVLAFFGHAAITAAVPLQPLRDLELDKRAAGDLDIIERALAPVSDSLSNLDSAILALDGTPGTAANLLAFSQQAQVATDQATVQIQSANDIGAFRAARLRRTTDSLIDQTTTTVSDLVSRKPILDNLGVSNVALESLQRQKISTMALTAALEEKVPRVGQRIAAEGRAQIESVLDQGISAYSTPAVAAAPPPAAAPVPPAAAPAPPAAAPAPPAAAPAPPAVNPANPSGIPLASPAPPAVAPTPQPPAVPAVGVPPAPVPAPAPNVPAAPMPVPVPPPQVTPPAGRRDKKKKKKANANILEVETTDDTADH